MSAETRAGDRKARNWLITGASSGLGRALALAALRRGDRVFGGVRRESDAAAFDALADQARAVRLDVTDEVAVRSVVADVEARSGGIDVVVNNAGYGLVAAVEEASAQEVRAQFEVNFFGALAMMQAVLPHMRARRAGHIVNISSVSGLVGWPSLGIYSASKFALEGVSETLALELEPLGVRITLIEPGGLRTDFAGRSRVNSARVIPDYDPTVGASRRLLQQHQGQERGDPQRAAEAIIGVVDAPAPPLRLLLGSDALGYAEHKLQRQIADIAHWRSVSLSTDDVR